MYNFSHVISSGIGKGLNPGSGVARFAGNNRIGDIYIITTPPEFPPPHSRL